MNRYRILVNASNLKIGGGVQVGVSFIEYIKSLDSKKYDFKILISEEIYNNIKTSVYDLSNIILISGNISNPILGNKIRKKIKYIERIYRPDLVYNIGHPAYVKFNTLTLARYTGVWELCNNKIAFSRLSYKEKFERIIRTKYRLWWAKYANFFETQTELAKKGICDKLNISEAKVRVFPNTPNKRFWSFADERNYKMITQKKRITIFSLAAPYKHKNLEIIPLVAYYLKKYSPYKNYNFILTIPQNHIIWKKITTLANKLKVNANIKTVGKVKLDESIKLYKQSDILFLPTLFEIFSVTYLEAMAMGVPLVTTNLDFAKEICNDAALYYSPLSPIDAAKKISLLISDDNLYNSIIDKGKDRLKSFPTPNQKNELLLNWMEEIINILQKDKRQ